MLRRAFVPPALVLLAACQPPAADEYVERTRIDASAEGPSEPIDSPDTENAIWAAAGRGDRLLFGNPGERPLLAFECVEESGVPHVRFTRYAAADPHAKAVLALIGNGHVSRFAIDAVRSGGAWLWQGEVPADSKLLDALTGRRQVEATVPGAGSVILNPSPLPGELVERCRSRAAPPAQGSQAAAASGPGAAAAPPRPEDTTGRAAPPQPPAA